VILWRFLKGSIKADEIREAAEKKAAQDRYAKMHAQGE
jgi:hypothetical protein